MVVGNLGRANLLITATDRASSKLTDIENNTEQLRKGFGQMAKAGTAATGALVAGGAAVSQEAGRAEGAMNKFETVFADSTDEMKAFTSEIRNDFPEAQHNIDRMAADLQDLLVPMGFAREEAMGMTQEMLEISNALAAFNDEDPERVLNAMESGLQGQFRPLRQFGVQLSQAQLETIALEEGLVDTKEELEEMDDETRRQIDSQAMMAGVIEQSSDALEGFEDNNDSYIRRQQDLRAGLKELRASLGQGLLPMFDDAVQTINPLVNGFSDWAEENQQLVGRIFAVATAGSALVAGLGILGITAMTVGSGIAALTTIIGALSLPIVAAVGAVTALGLAYNTNFMGMRDKTHALADSIKSVVVPVINTFIEIGQVLLSTYLDVFGRMLKAFGGFVEEFSGVYSGVLRPIITQLGTQFIIMGNVLKNVVTTGARLFKRFAEGLTDFIFSAADNIKSAIEGISDTVIDGIQSMLDAASEAASEVPGVSISAPTIDKPDFGGSIISDMESALDDGNDMLEGLQLNMADALAGDDARRQVKALQDSVGGLDDDIAGMGQSIQGAGQGMMDMSDTVANADIEVGGESPDTSIDSDKERANEEKKQRQELEKLRRFMEQREQNGGENNIQIDEINVPNGDADDVSQNLEDSLKSYGLG